MSLKVSFDIITGEFERRMEELQKPIAETAVATMDEVLSTVKVEGRASIAAAGFSRRWQNALRFDRFPRGNKKSINAAVFVHHRIVYAGVFEDGATIVGNPLMWVPLPSSPKRIGRNRFTPRNYNNMVGPLVSMSSRSGTPLLGATVRMSRTNAAQERPKVTLATLRRGRTGRGILRTIPLFFGIRSTQIEKKFNITQICEAARDAIPSIYARLFVGN